MTTTITPASGQGALYTQQGAGTTPGYSALDDRRLATAALQEGVYGTSTAVTAGGVSSVTAADFMVTQRGAGANLSVDINMPAGGMAFVQGDTLSGQGLYGVPVHSANINEPLATADVSNPRVDQVILEVLDNVLDASGGNLARTRVVTGTPTSGANLTNRSGAPVLPGSALLLADVLVAANATSVANTVIRDRRTWARGCNIGMVRNSGASSDDYSTSSTTPVAMDATGLSCRLECSGVPLRITFTGSVAVTAAPTGVHIQPRIDAAVMDGGDGISPIISAANTDDLAVGVWDIVPSAGSHVFSMWFYTNSSTLTVRASAAKPLHFTIRESLHQNTNNGVVTSG